MDSICINVDTDLTGLPVNKLPLIDDTDFKTIETGIVYNESGMDLVWHFITTAGVYTQTAVTPTTSGVHDWSHKGDGFYTIEVPNTGGTISNDTEGFGWFSGVCDGVLPWSSFLYVFRPADLNTYLVNDATRLNKLNVAGTLAHSGTASTYQADISTVASSSQADTIIDYVDELEARLTANRASYLDNLNIGEDVAGVSDVQGGTGDWTATEREYIRYRLSMDGTKTAPSTDTDNLKVNVTKVLGSAADTQIQSYNNAALVALHLDHLGAVSVDPASLPFTSNSVLDRLLENNGGVLRYKEEALDALSVETSGTGLLLSTTVATVTSQTNFTTDDGPPDTSAFPSGTLVVIRDSTTANQVAIGYVSTYTAETGPTAYRTVLQSDPGIFTIAVGDTVEYYAVPDIESVTTAYNSIISVANTPVGQVSGFPEELIVGDAYLRDTDRDIKMYFYNSAGNVMTTFGTKSPSDSDFLWAIRFVPANLPDSGDVNADVEITGDENDWDVTDPANPFLSIELPSADLDDLVVPSDRLTTEYYWQLILVWGSSLTDDDYELTAVTDGQITVRQKFLAEAP